MSEAKFGVNDLVFIRPDKVDSYFMLENPRGKIVRDPYNGMVKVEIFDTASQDTEGHNCTGKFAVGDISFQPFPVVPREAKPAAHPEIVWVTTHVLLEEFRNDGEPRIKADAYTEEEFIYHKLREGDASAYVPEILLQEARERERLLTEALEDLVGGCANTGFYGPLKIPPGGCTKSKHSCAHCRGRELLAKIRGTNG